MMLPPASDGGYKIFIDPFSSDLIVDVTSAWRWRDHKDWDIGPAKGGSYGGVDTKLDRAHWEWVQDVWSTASALLGEDRGHKITYREPERPDAGPGPDTPGSDPIDATPYDSTTPSVKEDEHNVELLQAVVEVLSDSDNEWMTTHELADEVNQRGLRRDDGLIDADQIHACTQVYGFFFEMERDLVRLRERDASLSMPQLFHPASEERLADWLATQDGETALITFDQLDDLDIATPGSAWNYRVWPPSNVFGFGTVPPSWRVAGFRIVRIDYVEGWVLFHRDEGDDGATGVREPRQPSPNEPPDEIRKDLPDEDTRSE